ncbi:hypothetical protein Tco_0180783 [Tanacetum coccineum]
MWERTRFIKLEVVRRSGFPVWLEYVTGITFTTDDEPFEFQIKRQKALIFEYETTSNQSLMPQNDEFINDVHQQSSRIHKKQQGNKRAACKHNYSLGVGFNNVENDPIQDVVNENRQQGDIHLAIEDPDTDRRSNNRDSHAITRVYALQLQMNDAGMATLDESFGKNEAAIAAVEETTQDHE